jgi:hypothetical protein
VPPDASTARATRWASWLGIHSRAAEVTQLRSLTVCRPLRALRNLASGNPDAVADLRPIVVEARRRGLITERELSATKELRGLRAVL